MSNYKQISEYIYDCKNCPTPCDGISKGIYNFKNDVEFSEYYENLIIDKINTYPNYQARKTTKDGYPDIEIRNKKTGEITSYLEIKVQRRTFMSVEKILPQANLKPSETLALNLSDLLRYFDIQKETQVPTSIMWILINRPCIVAENEIAFFYQSTNLLEKIYNKAKDKRRFRRKSGKGDIVYGVHKGVVVNYHFSIKELKKWKFIIAK